MDKDYLILRRASVSRPGNWRWMIMMCSLMAPSSAEEAMAAFAKRAGRGL